MAAESERRERPSASLPRMRTLLPALAVAAAALPSFAQQQDFSKVEIKATRVSGNVFMLEGAGGNIAAIVGDDGIAMVDSQYAPLAAKIHAALAKLSPRPVRFLINTHFHPDHTGGNADFADTAVLLASANVRKRLASGATHPITGKPIAPSPSAALPVVTFDEGLALHFDGEEIRTLGLRPGHTDGDSAVWFVKANVVHLGDDFVTYGFPLVDVAAGGSVKGMIAALDEVVSRIPADAKIIPGHGPLSTVADVKKFARSLEEMLAAVAKAKKPVGVEVLAPWAPWGAGFIKAEQFLPVLVREVR